MNKIPSQSLQNPTLQALHALGGSGRNREIHDKVVELLGLSEEVIAIPHKLGQTKPTDLEYKLAWNRTWLKHYGLLENSSKGVWSLTPKGKETHKVDVKEVDRVVNEKLKREKNAKEGPSNSVTVDVDGDLPDTDGLGLDEVWREELYTVLSKMDPTAFERLCQRVLRESGFTQVEVIGKSGDGGIDGIGVVRIGGFLSFKVLFQCKRYKGSIGASVVRDFRGAMMGRTDKGLIVTTGNFTRAAKCEATRDGAPEIDLIDGEQLIDKLAELELGVSQEMVPAYTVHPDFFNNI